MLDDIVDYLTGAATPQQADDIDTWRRQSADNEALFTQLREIWFSVTASQKDSYDSEAAFEAFKLNVAKLGRRPHLVAEKPVLRHRLMKVAAAVVALVVTAVAAWTGGYMGRGGREGHIIVSAPQGSQTVVLLPDSSEVRLNAGSKLTYGQNFGSDNRLVSLEGEALFSVHHDGGKPFIVKSNDFEVRVTGTKFNFRNYRNDDEAAVVLLRGSVAIDDVNSHRQMAALTPGQSFVYNKPAGTTRITAVDTARVARWTHGQLFFDEKLLTDIAKDMERTHGVNVVIENDGLRTKRFYGSFALSDSPATIMRTLAMTGGIRYRIEGHTIIIY